MKKISCLFTGIVLSVCLAGISLAESTLIMGDSDSLSILMHTKCLEDKPVLIFTEESGNMDAGLLNKVDNIMFYDSNWEDLAIELSSQIVISYPSSSLKIKKGGIYELWLDASEFIGQKEALRWQVKLDKAEVDWVFKQPERRYIQVGEYDLRKGKHSIEIRSDKTESSDIKQIKLLLVNKKERELTEAKVWQKINNPRSELKYILSGKRGEFFINSREGKPYNLKMGLKPRVFETEVYWQGRSKTNWKEEIRHWRFGLLNEENIQPVIISKEVFPLKLVGPREKNIAGIKVAGIAAFNPLSVKMKVYLDFSIDAGRRKRNLAIYLNSGFLKTIALPKKNGFTNLRVMLLLEPGINEIDLFSTEHHPFRDLLGFSRKILKSQDIKLKDFELKYIERIYDRQPPPAFGPTPVKPGSDILEIPYSKTPIVLSRDLNINLEEFPLLNLEAEFSGAANWRVIPILGIDYTGDGIIDGYLKADGPGVHHILSLAKQRWKEEIKEGKGLFLRKIILLAFCASRGGDEEIEGSAVFRLKKIVFLNDYSLILAASNLLDNKLRFEEINSKTFISEKDGTINILGSSSIDASQAADSKPEKNLSGVRVYVPLDNKLLKDFPYFSLEYKVGKPEDYSIELGILTRHQGREAVIKLNPNQYTTAEKDIEVNFGNIGYPVSDIKGIVITLTKSETGEEIYYSQPSLFRFRISNLQLYNKFPYPLKSEQLRKDFLALIPGIRPALKIDGTTFYLNDFDLGQEFNNIDAGIIFKRIELAAGFHNYQDLENGTFDIEWLALEPAPQNDRLESGNDLKVIFKKINPTRYLVEIKGAKKPFWLVFSENFHNQWKVFSLLPAGKRRLGEMNSNFAEFKNIIADYPGLGIKESKPEVKFTPQDIKFLFKRPLNAPHYMVNGYANGWYVDPEKLGLGGNFFLTIYFLPQSLFYLGLLISGLIISSCVLWWFLSYVKTIIRAPSGRR